jgi:hypothetical protein
MITKDNEPIYQRADGSYVLKYGNGEYGVNVGDNNCLYPYTEVQAYLLDHPEAMIPEPKPPEPTQEELDRREEQSLLAYLASTDWYAVRFAETGQAIPEDVVTQRAEARARISEMRENL